MWRETIRWDGIGWVGMMGYDGTMGYDGGIGWMVRKIYGRTGLMHGYLQVAERIRHRVDTYTAAFPAVLEIPSKEHPYDPEKDSVLRRVRRLFGE